MKVSQEGIEEIKKNPGLVKKVKHWLNHEESYACPLTRSGRRAELDQCLTLCNKIWPSVIPACPCCLLSIGKKQSIRIAKQIVGEEATNVREIPTEQKSHT